MSSKYLLILIFVFHIGSIVGQTITGKVVDASTGESLAFVLIEVNEKQFKTSSDEAGMFVLDINGLTDETTIRFSTIGYPVQIFSIKELTSNQKITVRLESLTVPLSEVVITPGKKRKVGMTKCAPGPTFGFEATHLGKGYERGLKIELGEAPVFVKSLHIRVHKNSVDTSLLLLHVRNIANETPANELLKKKIILSITKKSGWIEIDLSRYQLVFQGDIILSMELLDAKGKTKRKPTGEIIHFNTAKAPTGTYTKQGREMPWELTNDRTPSFYLTVL